MIEFNLKNMILSKIASEIRYEKNILFFDLKKLHAVGTKFKDNLPQVDFDQNNKQFVLVNPTKKIIGSITPERAAIQIDNLSEFSKFKSLANSFYNEVTFNLEIDEINRIGTRFFMDFLFENIDEAVSELTQRFFPPSNWEIIGNPPNSYNFRLEFFGETMIKLSLGTVEETIVEIQNNVQVKNENHKMIRIDCDIISNKVKPAGINGYLNSTMNIIEKRIFPFLNSFKGE